MLCCRMGFNWIQKISQTFYCPPTGSEQTRSVLRSECQGALSTLRKDLMNLSVSQDPNFYHQFQVSMNASAEALDAILVQQTELGNDEPG